MSTPMVVCAQCGASAETGRIFCTNCGTGLKTPVSLIPADIPDTPSRISWLRRAITIIVKGIGGLAALTFWFSRLTTNSGIVLFIASIVVGGLCLIVLSHLDNDFLKGRVNEGYWPSKPLDLDGKAEKPRDGV